ncbi:MAG TPA: MFS transporter, partial [Tepidisphaeraceae bacterium]
MPEPTVVDDPSPATPTRKGTFGLLFLIVLVDMMGFGIIIPLLPFYARTFEAGNVQVTLLLSVYALCQFVAAPMLGSMSDRVGRRPILVFSQFGSATASIILGLATALQFENATIGLGIIYLSRIIDGISGGNISAAQAYVSDVVPTESRAKYLGLLGAAFGIGFALGPGIGGVLGHFLGPAWPPFAAAAFALTAGTLAYFRLPESLQKSAAPHAGRQWSRSFALMRRPVLAQLVMVWFLSMFAFVTAEAILPLFLADSFGFGELGVGLTFTLAGVIIIIVQGALIGPLKQAIGEWWIAVIGPLLFTIGMLLYGQAALTPVVWLLIVAVIFNAFGRSLQ